MSKSSNVQRIDALKLWIASTIKIKSKECQMFINPQKRKEQEPHDINAVVKKASEVELEALTEEDIPIVTPHRKKRI